MSVILAIVAYMDLRINNVERSLIAKAKAAATNAGFSLRQWIINLLAEKLK
jgi:predicted HicB family RNase H-like nuclease